MKPLEADDPMELVGVVLPAGAEAMREMAYVFAEEFARLGFDEVRLLRLFKNPFYAGLHQAYCALGEPVVREIVGECVRVWGRGRPMPDNPRSLSEKEVVDRRSSAGFAGATIPGGGFGRGAEPPSEFPTCEGG